MRPLFLPTLLYLLTAGGIAVQVIIVASRSSAETGADLIDCNARNTHDQYSVRGANYTFNKFLNTTQCYCDSWNYFVVNNRKFFGESGSLELKKSLNHLKNDILDSFRFWNPLTISRRTVDLAGLIGVDVGANVGQGAIFLNNFLPDSSNDKYLFEPNPANVPLLQNNIKSLNGVHIVEKAVGQSSGQLLLDVSVGKREVGNTHGQLARVRAKGRDMFEVDVVTLDDFFGSERFRERPILYMKTDAEGYDVTIMRGAKETLSRTRFLVFECHVLMKDGKFRGPGTTHYEAQQILSSLGFSVFKISKEQWVLFSDEFYNQYIDDTRFMGWHNCFAIRRSDPILKNLFESHNTISSCQFKDV